MRASVERASTAGQSPREESRKKIGVFRSWGPQEKRPSVRESPAHAGHRRNGQQSGTVWKGRKSEEKWNGPHMRASAQMASTAGQSSRAFTLTLVKKTETSSMVARMMGIAGAG